MKKGSNFVKTTIIPLFCFVFFASLVRSFALMGGFSLKTKRLMGGSFSLATKGFMIFEVFFSKAHQRLYDDFFAPFQAYTEVAGKDPSTHIGFEITRDRDRARRTITIYRAQKVNDLLEKHRFENAHPEDLPAQKGLVLSFIDAPADGSPEQEKMKKCPFREIVGSSLYLSVMTTVYVLYGELISALFNRNPGETHWNSLRHLLRFPLSQGHN